MYKKVFQFLEEHFLSSMDFQKGQVMRKNKMINKILHQELSLEIPMKRENPRKCFVGRNGKYFDATGVRWEQKCGGGHYTDGRSNLCLAFFFIGF
jgi:hypothetical protein